MTTRELARGGWRAVGALRRAIKQRVVCVCTWALGVVLESPRLMREQPFDDVAGSEGLMG